MTVALAPLSGVRTDGAGFFAEGAEPWLRLELDAAALAGRWIVVSYDAPLCAPVVRPLLAFGGRSAERREILPAPSLGRGIWVGRVPERTTEIAISPVDRAGPFAFRVVAVDVLSRGRRLATALRNRPLRGFAAHALELVDVEAAERPMRRAVAARPLARYAKWRALRARAPEWSEFDAPTAPPGSPRVRVLTASDAAGAAPMAGPWPGVELSTPADGSNVTDALRGLGDRDLVMVARTDDEWADGAATILAVAASRDEADVLYADEELASNGRLHPRFKPDWSPILAERADLFGRAWAARVGWLRAHFGAQRVRDLAGEPLRPAAGAKAFHVARPLLRRADAPAARFDASVPPAPAILAGKPFATLIIPTRDRAELLSACVASLDRPGGRTDYHAIVVDNGSVTDEADRLFDRLRADARFEVMRIDAPFNYSALCNAAAARARADALVFLNNDVEARSSDWLADIVRWTPLRGVGAVGARLLYPGGTLQHGGVVLGIDGQACHFERGGDPSARGFFDRADAPHEISAVTAACLAVERAKFEAVGGFDARNLPVEYSDIDLCLRLGERGWGALMAPAATLVHREAATRKVAKSQESRYAAEVAHFRARWAHVLRADPYFHPALSLDWHSAALG